MPAVIIVPFLLAAALWALLRQPLTDVDSVSYLGWDPMRTAGYPMFLDLAEGPGLLPLQLFMLAGSLAWLAVTLARVAGKPILASLCVLLIAANPYLWQLQATIMSEAITTPLMAILVGCIAGFAYTRRAGYLVIAALICGLATVFRPSCLPLILAPLAALFMAKGTARRAPLAIAMLVLWAGPIAAERLYSRKVHGAELTSPMGRHAFMKAAVIDAPAVTARSSRPLDQFLARTLNTDLEPVRRIIRKAPDRNIRYVLLSNYEACLGYQCGDYLVKGFKVRRSEIDRAMLNVGLARLASNPLGYLALTATEYHRLWLLHPRKQPELASRYNAFLAREAPLPFQDLLGEYAQPTPQSQQSPLLRINRAAFAGIGLIAGLLTFLLAMWHANAGARAALCLLLAAQAVLVVGSFLGVGLPRYPMGLWPMLVPGIVLGAAGLWEVRKRRA